MEGLRPILAYRQPGGMKLRFEITNYIENGAYNRGRIEHVEDPSDSQRLISGHVRGRISSVLVGPTGYQQKPSTMNYPEPLQTLIPAGNEMELAAGRPNAELRAALARFDLAAAIAPHPITDPSLAEACLAGLWLAHNFLDESHAISQGIHSPTGSFWHGIMHRREGDFDNACYWFRRVGEHPVYPVLKQAAARCLTETDIKAPPELTSLAGASRWEPTAFVEVVRSVVAHPADSPAAALCRRIARREWVLLFDYCYGGALGTAWQEA